MLVVERGWLAVEMYIVVDLWWLPTKLNAAGEREGANGNACKSGSGICMVLKVYGDSCDIAS